MNKLIVLILCILSVRAYSQDYMDIVAKKTCKCMDSIADTLDTQTMYLQVGVCMFSAAGPYKKQIKKDYGITFDGSEGEGEKLGSIVGVKMASICPEKLIAMSNKAQSKKMPETTRGTYSVNGEITNVSKDFFVVFSVKDSDGNTAKYIWLNNIEGDLDLVNNYEKLNGQKVDISYNRVNFFDPRIGEYRLFNVIRKMVKAY